MPNWHDNVLRLIAEIDRCIRAHEGETLTLAHLARLLDCSQSQVSHQFHALTGTSLRDFVQARRPALALPAVRDGEQRLLDIALDCGFPRRRRSLARSVHLTASRPANIGARPARCRCAR